MKYMLLIYTDESADAQPGEPTHQELWDAYVALDQATRKAGVLVDSQPFTPISEAVTVEVRDGIPRTVAGPAMDTRLQLSGYYLLECASIDEAAGWAAQIPGAAAGSVEIRPVLELD